jgi:membrane-associated phospholipid phosphatase
MVSVGFWPLTRKLSTGLALWTFALISLPRVYLGGHYPIDVLASVVLGSVILAAIWPWRGTPTVCNWLVCEGPVSRSRNVFLLLWIIELADGFRGAELLFSLAQRLLA